MEHNTAAMVAPRKVYGSLESPATLKVLAALFEHRLDFEFIPVDVDAGENMKQPFLSMSPFGEVPVHQDGPVTQFQYGAILRSMAHKYANKGEELICFDCKPQALVANWIDVEDTKFRPPADKLLDELILKPAKGLPADGKTLAEASAEMGKVLDVYEAQLSKHRFLAMDKYTIVDVLHLPYLQAFMGVAAARELVEARPKVQAWCAGILGRPAWKKVLQMKQSA